jgi:steroid delta-isomerase-like uncharacterized protein
MRHEQLEQALASYAQAKNRHDVEAIVALRTDDCVDHSVATGMRIEGREAIGRFFRAFFASVPDYYGDFDGTAYGEDTAVVWGRWGGTLTGDIMGLEVEPGRRIEIPCAFVCTFRDGLLVEDLQYFDAATLAEQLGVPLRAISERTTGLEPATSSLGSSRSTG